MMDIKLKNQAILFAASSDVITESIPYDKIKSLITDEKPYRVYLSTIKKEDSSEYIILKTGKKIINTLADKVYLVNGIESVNVIRYYLAYLHNKHIVSKNLNKDDFGYDYDIDMSINLEDINIICEPYENTEKRYIEQFKLKC